MSGTRTRPAESAQKRDGLRDPQRSTGRVTRAEWSPATALLEYIGHLGGHLKWVNTFYGGEMRAG
jgi:hypothetical protein